MSKSERRLLRKAVGKQLAFEEGLTANGRLPSPAGVALVRRQAPVRGVRPAMVVVLENVGAERPNMLEGHEDRRVERCSSFMVRKTRSVLPFVQG